MAKLVLLMFTAAFAVITLHIAKGETTVAAKAFIKPDCKKQYPEKVYGMVYITQSAGGKATFRVKLVGLTPNTYHGFHVHQYGDIYSNGCLSTGGHYNPFGKTHGGPQDSLRHVGDLGNVKSDAKGYVDVTFEDTEAGIIGQYSVAGRAFVVHQKKDDLGKGTGDAAKESKKTGNAGSRLACGVIYYTNPTDVKNSMKK